eukprot:GILI01003780.1.p1 GENE.GILI01003780.1~~GILI01003780.1.p1  ORF type:complete len:721 (+),score=269.62 GILI01003780.1:54-2216(+)
MASSLTLTAAAGAPCTLRALVLARLANVSLNFCGDVSKLVTDPQGDKIPELTVSNGEVIQFGRAIARYLARLGNSDLNGRSFFESGLVDQWLEFSVNEIDQYASLVPKLKSLKEDARAKVQDGLKRAFTALNDHLLHNTFMVGRGLTLADVAVLGSIHAMNDVELVKPYTNLYRWYQTVLAQPKVQPALSATPSASASSSSVVSVPSLLGSVTLQEKSFMGDRTQWPAVPPVHPTPPTKSYGGRTRIKAIRHAGGDGTGMIGKRLTVAGWVKTARVQGAHLIFLQVNDGSCFGDLQVVINKDVPNFAELGKVNIGYSVAICGVVVASPAAGQKCELLVKGEPEDYVKIVGACDPATYPMGGKKFHTMEFLREHANLRPRTNLIGAVTRVRNALAYATHQFFQTRGFLYIHTPLITASDCEGAGEMFQVTTLIPKDGTAKLPMHKDGKVNYNEDFFRKPAFLTVSGQLSVENFSCAMSDVYTFGPTFRAENSHTSRHLAEFWMIEPEMAFADLEDDMECAESYLKFCLTYVLENCLEDLQFFDKNIEKGLIDRLRNVVNNAFAKVSYTEAIELLHKSGVKFENKCPNWGDDLNSEHERWLAETKFKKPVIVYNYPKDIKAFYMKLNEDGRTVRAMDILVPKIGEVIGGSQREENLEVLQRRITDMGLELEPYWWYLELRKYGSVPHCGFGLGFERLIMMCTGVENIRDVIPFPRVPGHAEF